MLDVYQALVHNCAVEALARLYANCIDMQSARRIPLANSCAWREPGSQRGAGTRSLRQGTSNSSGILERLPG